MSRLDDLTKNLAQTMLQHLSDQQQLELAQCLQVLADDQKYNKFKNYFPDEGKYRRELYPKHLEFFAAGKTHRKRGFIAGNRVGKTESGGGYEVVCHATGQYPDWWQGYRFRGPIHCWVGGDTATTLRDIIQKKLIGELNDIGSGLIPKDSIIWDQCKTRRNVPDALEIIRIKHITGGVSTIVLKSYEQGRVSWQGTEVDLIWLDEEPPQDIYGEALIRLMTTEGLMMLTFTPLSGLTDVVLTYLENSQDVETDNPHHVTVCGWSDVPHITEEMKKEMLAATPPQLRDARSKGVPTVGSGLIYPIEAKEITVDDFKIPKHWMRLNGMDVGWNNTACIFGAWDRDNDIVYIYSEHKQGQAEPIIHAKAVKARGEWIRTTIDPASRGRSQVDGENLFNLYQKEGLKLIPANNSVESGIFTVWERFVSGRLKIFTSCGGTIRELSLYHRDDTGKIVKKNDHLLDCLRYLLNAEQSCWSYPQAPQNQQKVVDIRSYMSACT